jgi:16S rRNA (cytosine967-C5)-methyltransferase
MRALSANLAHMRYILLHITTIITTYHGELPLAHFLKNYFKQHPILGSRDRRMLTSMAYSWYRAARGISADAKASGIELEAKIKKCLALCGNEVPFLLQQGENSEGQEAEIKFDSGALFPYDIALSDGITKEEWLASMLVQPDLFMRIRKDKGKIVSLLNNAAIPFTFISENCLSLPNGAKIDTILPVDAFVVQDASSQQTGNFFKPKKK